MLATQAGHDLCADAVDALRLHRRAVVHAMLEAELDVEQAQEMPDLGRGADGGLGAATAQALLDRDRGRNAMDRIDLGPSRRLHDRARVGVEALQVAALALVEQDIERERGLARAADPGDDAEAPARNVHAQALEVVLARVDDMDRVGMLRTGLCNTSARVGRGEGHAGW